MKGVVRLHFFAGQKRPGPLLRFSMIARYVCLSRPVAEYLSYFQISETFVYVTHSFVMAIYSSMVAHCQIVEIWRHLATSVACVLRFIIARHMFIYDNFNILLSKSCSCIATPWYYTRTWWFEAILYIHYNNNISQQIIVFTLYIAKCATMVSRISWWENRQPIVYWKTIVNHCRTRLVTQEGSTIS